MAITNQQIPRVTPSAYKTWVGVGALTLIGGAYMLRKRTSQHEPGCNCIQCFKRSGNYKKWGPRERPNSEEDTIKD